MKKIVIFLLPFLLAFYGFGQNSINIHFIGDKDIVIKDGNNFTTSFFVDGLSSKEDWSAFKKSIEANSGVISLDLNNEIDENGMYRVNLVTNSNDELFLKSLLKDAGIQNIVVKEKIYPVDNISQIKEDLRSKRPQKTQARKVTPRK